MTAEPPSKSGFSRFGLGEGPPPAPLQASGRGYAKALAAAAVHILTGKRQRYVWEVDLDTEVTLEKIDLPDPSFPASHTQWGAFIFRFRNALDMQPWGSFNCRVVLAVLRDYPGYGKCRAVYAIPWLIDLTRFGGRPPVGRWLLEPLPPFKNGLQDCEGDLEPGYWWTDGLPF